MLMSDAGGGNAVSGVTLTFDDDAAGGLPDSGALTTGVWLPTDHDQTDLFDPPAPADPYTRSLAVFNGLNPNGSCCTTVVPVCVTVETFTSLVTNRTICWFG